MQSRCPQPSGDVGQASIPLLVRKASGLPAPTLCLPWAQSPHNESEGRGFWVKLKTCSRSLSQVPSQILSVLQKGLFFQGLTPPDGENGHKVPGAGRQVGV